MKVIVNNCEVPKSQRGKPKGKISFELGEQKH